MSHETGRRARFPVVSGSIFAAAWIGMVLTAGLLRIAAQMLHASAGDATPFVVGVVLIALLPVALITIGALLCAPVSAIVFALGIARWIEGRRREHGACPVGHEPEYVPVWVHLR